MVAGATLWLRERPYLRLGLEALLRASNSCSVSTHFFLFLSPSEPKSSLFCILSASVRLTAALRLISSHIVRSGSSGSEFSRLSRAKDCGRPLARGWSQKVPNSRGGAAGLLSLLAIMAEREKRLFQAEISEELPMSMKKTGAEWA